MQKDKLTFNDLPEVVGELCERIASMETLLAEKLHQQHNEVKKDTHVPMTVDEVLRVSGNLEIILLLQSQAWRYPNH